MMVAGKSVRQTAERQSVAHPWPAWRTAWAKGHCRCCRRGDRECNVVVVEARRLHADLLVPSPLGASSEACAVRLEYARDTEVKVERVEKGDGGIHRPRCAAGAETLMRKEVDAARWYERRARVLESHHGRERLGVLELDSPLRFVMNQGVSKFDEECGVLRRLSAAIKSLLV